ncbi:MAG: ribulose-phosphate 3-epimerase [Firmicutes bacterium]|nr:ribulose-phosphate 3-epimerase [Bacillota bacterium]
MINSSEMRANSRKWRWLQNGRIVSPSLMCADLLNLGRDIRSLEAAGADALHVDMMDGHFVDNLGFSYDLLKQVRAGSRLPIDVHLMVQHPETVIERVLAAGADLCIFHSETTSAPLRLLRTIHSAGAAAGIALNPTTSVESIRLLLPFVQLVLVMMVEPGFAGQRLLSFSFEKIRQLNDLRKQENLEFAIGIEGAVSEDVADTASGCGAAFFVGGTQSIFRTDGTSFADAVHGLKKTDIEL